jgi:hypothetical protein
MGLPTPWLFTKDGRAVKGEGLTDAEALSQVRKQIFNSPESKVEVTPGCVAEKAAKEPELGITSAGGQGTRVISDATYFALLRAYREALSCLEPIARLGRLPNGGECNGNSMHVEYAVGLLKSALQEQPVAPHTDRRLFVATHYQPQEEETCYAFVMDCVANLPEEWTPDGNAVLAHFNLSLTTFDHLEVEAMGRVDFLPVVKDGGNTPK